MTYTPEGIVGRARRVRRLPLLPTMAGAVLAGAVFACAGEPSRTGQSADHLFARPAEAGATGGAYLTVYNHDTVAVQLVGASSPVARAVEVHETTQHEGMAHMMARPTITIPARDALAMKPGGVHLMLVQLNRALVVGDTVPVTLRFARDGAPQDSLLVRIPVRTP